MIAAASAQIVGSTTNLHQQQKDEVEIAYSIITDIFSRCPHLDFLIWICPANFVLSDHIQQLFSPLAYESEEDTSGTIRKLFQGMKILFLHRSRYLPKLFVRSARVEDNDDLIPIIQNSNPEILQDQESYFLSELIQKADHKNRYFVGLKDNDAPVGMLATGVDVNMALIMKIFDIDMYQDLVIQSDYVPPPPPLLITIVGDVRLIDLEGLKSSLDDDHCHMIDFEQVRMDWHQFQIDNAAHFERQDDSHPPTSMLAHFVRQIINESRDPELQAIIMWGLPSTEDDASRLVAMIAHEFDVVLELVNTSEDAEEDEEDEYLQHHLDAVEIMREYFFSEDSPMQMGASFRTPFSSAPLYSEKKAQWRKISFDKETALQLKHENIQRFYGALSVCFDERRERMEQARLMQQEKPPTANGFAVTALCMEEAFLSRSIDLLKLAFEEQPDLAYCLYMLPNDQPPNPATRAFNFVKTRPGVSFDQSLYIIHKSFFFVQEHMYLERFKVDMLKDESYESFLAPLSTSERLQIQEDVKGSLAENDLDLLDNPSQVTFSVKMGDNIVGVFTLSRKLLANDDINWLRAHYHLDDHVTFARHRLRSQYILSSWLLDPVFAHWTRLILQIMMRKCNKTVLYYHVPEKEVAPPKEIAEEFIFVRPRRRAQGEHQPFRLRPSGVAAAAAAAEALAAATASNANAATTTTTASGALASNIAHKPVVPGEDSPLFLMTKGNLAHWKTIVAKRMVIVGGSSHSYSFLETFTSVPGIYYPNVYFITGVLPTPFRSVLHPQSAVPQSPTSSTDNLAQEDDFSGCLSLKDVEFPLQHELWALGYPHRINILQGHMTDIDRDHRAVVISDEIVLEYDYLLISSCTIDHSARRISSLAHVHPAKCADAGIFSLGNPSADLLAVQWAQRRTANKNDPIVIAGSALKALTAAQGLIRAGIPASKIICVTSDADNRIAGCGSSTVSSPGDGPELCGLLAHAVAENTIGLRAFLWRSEVSEVVLSRNGFISAVDIRALDVGLDEEGESKGPINRRIHNSNGGNAAMPRMMMQKEPCAGLYLCDADETLSSCERDVFAAINDSGLVFDGGIIVDLVSLSCLLYTRERCH